MLEVLLLSLFFALGMSGWGHLVYKFLFAERPAFPTSIFLGLIFSSQIALTLHFFTPLAPVLTSALVLIGFLFFIWQNLEKPKITFSVSFYIVAAVSFILMAGYGLDNNLYSDVVAYHFPTLEWIKNSKIVFGLANLHDRLGFNSIWHMTSSLSNPNLRWQSSMDYASIVFLWVYLINVYYLPEKLRFLGWICRGVAFLIWGKATFLINLGLPATDLPSTICCLLFYEKILTIFEKKKVDQKDFAEIFLIYFFAFQLKLSQIFLIFPFSVLIFSFRESVFIWAKEKKAKFITLAFLMVFPWLLRSFILSGCWLFPAGQSCFPKTAWSLPLADVALAKFYVLSWARVQNLSLDPFNWVEWFPAWAGMQFSRFHIQFFVFSIVGAAFLLIYNKVRNQKQNASAGLLMPVPSVFYFSIYFVLILWFMQGPDPRFAMGSFIFLQAIVIYFICHQFKKLLRYKVFLKTCLVLILCVYLQDMVRISSSAFLKSPIWSDRFVESDRFTVNDKTSKYGVAYKVPDLSRYSEGGCWLEEGLCANQERPFLSQTRLGSYLMFSTQEDKKNE